MILGSKIVELGLSAGAPSSAIFPQWIDKNTTFAQFWNYLRKQLVVLDTYCNFMNRILNHALLTVLCGCSFLYALQLSCTILATLCLLFYYTHPSSFSHLSSLPLVTQAGGHPYTHSYASMQKYSQKPLVLYDNLVLFGLLVNVVGHLWGLCCLKWMSRQILHLQEELGEGKF